MKHDPDDVLVFFQRYRNDIVNAWKSWDGGSNYPFDYQNPGGSFTRMLIPALPYLAGRVVLDIGCNAGLNSFVSSFSAKQVIGCDRSEVLISRAVAAKEVLIKHEEFSNITFDVGDFSSFLTDEVDAIIAARILYHLTDDGIEKLKDFILSKDEFVAVVHTRPGRKNGATKAYNGLIEIEDVERFFSDAGLTLVDGWGGKSQRYLVGKKERSGGMA